LPQSQKRHLVAVLHRLLHQLRRLHHCHHHHRGHHLLRLLVPKLIILLCLHRLIRVEILLKVTRFMILHVFTHFLGLKKVTSDMQTHKNPNLRGTSVVPSKPGSKAAAPTPKPKFGSAPVKKDPVTQLDGKKWMVSYSSYATQILIHIKIEYHDGNKDIAIETNMKQTVYIYKCVNSTIKVTGKGSFYIFYSRVTRVRLPHHEALMRMLDQMSIGNT